MVIINMTIKSAVLFCWVSITTTTTHAQKLQLQLSQYPGATAVIRVVQGTKKDTIGTVMLDSAGRGAVPFGSKLSWPALAELTIKDKQYLNYEFVLSPREKPILRCDGEYVHSQNTKLTGTIENNALNRWFSGWMQDKERTNGIDQLMRLYDSAGVFYAQLAKEKQNLLKKDALRWDTINTSSLFAARYMQFRKVQETRLAKVWESNEERKKARDYFLQELDFEALYGSSMWFDVINSCIEIWVKESPFYEKFGEDVVAVSSRIRTTATRLALKEAALAVCQRFSWHSDKEKINLIY